MFKTVCLIKIVFAEKSMIRRNLKTISNRLNHLESIYLNSELILIVCVESNDLIGGFFFELFHQIN